MHKNLIYPHWNNLNEKDQVRQKERTGLNQNRLLSSKGISLFQNMRNEGPMGSVSFAGKMHHLRIKKGPAAAGLFLVFGEETQIVNRPQ